MNQSSAQFVPYFFYPEDIVDKLPSPGESPGQRILQVSEFAKNELNVMSYQSRLIRHHYLSSVLSVIIRELKKSENHQIFQNNLHIIANNHSFESNNDSIICKIREYASVKYKKMAENDYIFNTIVDDFIFFKKEINQTVR